MKFSDEMFNDYGRHYDLLQQAERFQLVCQARAAARERTPQQASFLFAVRRYIRGRVRHMSQRSRAQSRSKLPG